MIPRLNRGECCFDISDKFFCPEVPGIHELEINGLPELVFAGLYGVSGRKYRIPKPGAPWFFAFYVSSNYEFRGLIIAFSALAVSIILLIITLIMKN